MRLLCLDPRIRIQIGGRLAAVPVGLSLALAAPTGATGAQALAEAACVSPTHATRLRAEAAPLPAPARAIWLDARTIRWPHGEGAAPAAAGTRYVLVAGTTEPLRVTPGQRLEGGEIVPLTVHPFPLSPAVGRRTRHVGVGTTLRLSAAMTSARLAALHSRGLLLVRLDGAGRVEDATRTQAALALDDLYAEAAETTPMGASPARDGTVFRVWAPTAQAVGLCLYGADTTTARVVPMQREERTGAWHTRVRDAAHGARYRYLVDVVVPGEGLVRNRVTDPYALALTANSSHAVVVDLAHPSLVPEGWRTRRVPRLAHPVDQVIYELHVRDFSVADARVPIAHRGRFLAFTDTASHGMRHLRALARAGLTDVHLLPVFDIATIPEVGCRSPDVGGTPNGGSPNGEGQQAVVVAAAAGDCFNWGYDPLHFTVPEGSYATSASDFAARIREFRRMVVALNGIGLRVGMDVVYNHTSAAGQAPQSVLDRIVPGYYHRLDANGRVETSTCCANTATEHRLMAKLMIESAVRWVRDYGISSFRFDLMGHQPRAAMERLQRAVNAAAGRHVPLIGEGWNFGEVADGARFVQASQRSLAGSGIATFSDRARDAVRGGSALDDSVDLVRNQGWASGLAYAPNEERLRLHPAPDDWAALRSAADMVRVGLAGTLRDFALHTADGATRRLADVSYGGQPAGYVQEPGEVVNYVENHDNPTLFDANVLKLPASTSAEDRARLQLLGSAVVLFSQGIAYVHAGQELLRSKSLDRNSFDSGDWFNPYDPSGETHGFPRGLPPARDNARTWPFMAARLADGRVPPSPALVRFTRDAFLDLLRIRASSSLFRLRTAREVRARLRFLDAPPDGGPAPSGTVIAAHLDGRAGRGVLPGARYRDVVFALNVGNADASVPVPSLRGRSLRLHPVHAAATAADPRPRLSRWNAESAVLSVPPRTAVVWVYE